MKGSPPFFFYLDRIIFRGKTNAQNDTAFFLSELTLAIGSRVPTSRRAPRSRTSLRRRRRPRPSRRTGRSSPSCQLRSPKLKKTLVGENQFNWSGCLLVPAMKATGKPAQGGVKKRQENFFRKQMTSYHAGQIGGRAGDTVQQLPVLNLGKETKRSESNKTVTERLAKNGKTHKMRKNKRNLI